MSPLTVSTRVQVARGSHTTVVMAEARYDADFAKALGVTGENRAVQTTADGVQVVDYSACKSNIAGVSAGALRAERAGSKAACQPTVESTHPWSEFGITDANALHQQIALVRDDGGSWQSVVAADRRQRLRPGRHRDVDRLPDGRADLAGDRRSDVVEAALVDRRPYVDHVDDDARVGVLDGRSPVTA